MWISGKFIIQMDGTGSGLCLLSVLKLSGSAILNLWSLPPDSAARQADIDRQIDK